MSRLSDLYKAIETLRKENLSTDELESMVELAEEEIIKNEILPIVTKGIAPALEQVQRELVLVVDYVPGRPMSVHLSRKRNFTADILDAKEILADPKAEHKEIKKSPKSNGQAAATRIKIHFSDGRVLQGENAADTFRLFVLELGVERVRSLGLVQSNVPLVSNTLDEKYSGSQKPLGNGFYLMTNSPTTKKKKVIEEIAREFGVRIRVEVI